VSIVTLKETNIKAMLAGAAVCALLINTPAMSAYQDEKPAKAVEAEKKAEKEAKSDEEKSDKKDKKDKKKKKKLIADVVKDMTLIDGLFKMYQSPKTGALSMEISADQLDKDFIYFSHIADGVVEGGHFRGQYRQEKVFKIRKHFDKIEFVEENASFYFDPENPLSRASDANTSKATIAVAKIVAKSEDGDRFLIKADKLFETEAFDQVKPTPNPRSKPWEGFRLGKLDKSKTRIDTIKNYPENTAVTVNYTYTNPSPLNYGRGAEITDARNITVKMQHTLIAMPENTYKPRYDDARVGYFLTYVNDMTSHDTTPWRDLIHRWHLEKKDPTAAVSEPVEPIVWWIENTTPENIRPTIKKAVESWNIAFEAAGFKNAVQVKIQPDDAEWDADDIRYNVLRWTSSPQPPFGGYGPSFVNPRTGQILGADIMLEYSFLTNRMNNGAVFETAALGSHAEHTDELPYIQNLKKHEHNCSLANHLQLNNLVGKTLNRVLAGDGVNTKEMVEESIYYLMLHEVGHTLGLNHNMKATQARAYSESHDISKQDNGLVGSVMDYPSINYSINGKDQGHYYTIRPGDYDIWAIEFGYDPDLDDPAKRETHLARSAEKGLAFGNDADDMRAPGRGIDPRINIFDFSDDAVQYAEDRLKLDTKAMKGLKDKFTKSGNSYQELRNAYFILTGDMAQQARVSSRYIGGVYVDRALAGQEGATDPYRPVEKAKQKQAMKLLRDYVFSPNAFAADAELLRHIAIQRRGFTHGGGTEDPKVHARINTIQRGILDHVLHPNTLLRITDTSLYGNDYSLTEMMGDLTDAIFEDDSRTMVNTVRQELQIMYVKRLIDILNSKNFDHIAQSNALSNLQQIKRDMARWRGDAATRAHREHITFLIEKALEVNKA
jgi:hypothetical protein